MASDYSVERLIPHKAPMILLGQVIEVGTEEATASIDITPESPFYDEALNGVSAVIGIEYMAQCISMCAGFRRLDAGKTIVPGFLLGAQSYECAQAVFEQGATLIVHVKLQMLSDEGVASFNCDLRDGSGKILAQAQVNAVSPNDPQPLIEHWLSEI